MPRVTMVSAILTIQILKYSLADPSKRMVLRTDAAGACGATNGFVSISGFPALDGYNLP